MNCGNIGAFIVGNETYIREYEEDGLHSINSSYPVLRSGEEEICIPYRTHSLGDGRELKVPARKDRCTLLPEIAD